MKIGTDVESFKRGLQKLADDELVILAKTVDDELRETTERMDNIMIELMIRKKQPVNKLMAEKFLASFGDKEQAH